MHLSAFDHFVGAIGFVEEFVLLYVLFSRNLAKTFPIFTTLVAFQVVEAGADVLVYSYLSPRAYYYTYWSMGTVDMLLQTALVYEIARHVFAPLKQWASDVRSSFSAVVWGSVVFAVLFSTLASPAETNHVARMIGRGTMFSSILLTELFVGLVALSATAGLPWRTHIARIAQGAGAYAFVSVLFDSCEVWLKWGGDASTIHTLSRVLVAFGRITYAYWIVTLWQKAPEPRPIPETMRVKIFHLNRQLEYDLGRIRGWRKV